MDKTRYEDSQEELFERYEGVCRRCGECCGAADGDPCANLGRDASTGLYFCRDYANRLGPQKTVSGKIFNCVPIRDIIKQGLLRPGCAYNNIGVKIPFSG